MSVGTAFHPRTAPLNRKMQWREWAGYFASSVYADFHDIEYNAIREAAAVIDVSPLYKYRRHRARTRIRLADRVITRDATRLKVGQVYYTPWCDEHGKVIDDGTVHRVGEQELRWTAADPQYRWLSQNAAGLDVEIEDVTESLAALALQGPFSRAVLEAADRRGLRGPAATSAAARATIGGVAIDVSRTGYTGDLGYELWIPAEAAPAVWDALFEAGKAYAIRPAGMLALDVTRLEAGLIMLEVDYTSARHAMNPEQNYSPFEIGLGQARQLREGRLRRPARAPGRAGRGRPEPPPRRPPARLVRHRGPVRRPGPAAGHQPLRRPLARPRLRRRAPGGQGHVARLEPDPQAGARPGVRAGALRAGRHASSRWSGRSRAAAAASPPASSSCRSSTSRASANDRRWPELGAPRRCPADRLTPTPTPRGWSAALDGRAGLRLDLDARRLAREDDRGAAVGHPGQRGHDVELRRRPVVDRDLRHLRDELAQLRVRPGRGGQPQVRRGADARDLGSARDVELQVTAGVLHVADRAPGECDRLEHRDLDGE